MHSNRTKEIVSHSAEAGMTIGFIGLGRMGSAMAANLAAVGYSIVAHVRHPERLDELAAIGINPVRTMDEMFDCRIVITMLPDDAAVAGVVLGSPQAEGLASKLAPGAIHLSMSTISPRCATDLAAQH